MNPPLLGVVGPTASGKTDLALALADRLPVEIVVADSRQVYRGMDVGTAKATPPAQQRVPHHLIDVVDPDEPFTVADWVERARTVVADIAARGRLPLLVGGTGLYVSALVDGHDYAAQPWSPELRQRLAEELEADGLEPLVERLGLLIRQLPRRSTCATRAACSARSSAPRPGVGERRHAPRPMPGAWRSSAWTVRARCCTGASTSARGGCSPTACSTRFARCTPPASVRSCGR